MKLFVKQTKASGKKLDGLSFLTPLSMDEMYDFSGGYGSRSGGGSRGGGTRGGGSNNPATVGNNAGYAHGGGPGAAAAASAAARAQQAQNVRNGLNPNGTKRSYGGGSGPGTSGGGGGGGSASYGDTSGTSHTPGYQKESNSNDYHCDINSWNTAIDIGVDPSVNNTVNWDGNQLTAAQVANQYEGATDAPSEGTAGLGFQDTNGDGVINHVFTYDNRDNNPNTYTAYDSNGIADHSQYTYGQNGRTTGQSIFVALPSL